MTEHLFQRMSDSHEAFLVNLFGGSRSPGSGNQWKAPMDSRTSRRTVEFAFAIDGKSTLSNSISVSRRIWQKAVDQSLSERPMLGLRFYENDGLDVAVDLAVVNAYDLSELIDRANGSPEV